MVGEDCDIMAIMILKSKERAKPWSPGGFDDFRKHYPATDWQEPAHGLDHTERFEEAWNKRAALPTSIAIVLTPGLFSEWLPGCFRIAQRDFAAAGHRCLRTRVYTGRTVSEQAQRLASTIEGWLQPNERFIWCTHSRGGFDALWALQEYEALAARCVATACVQIPVGHSWVVADIESAQSGLMRRALRRSFQLPFVAAGVALISKRRDPELNRWLQALEPVVPTIHAVSWSVQPTSWVDSWHARLNALRPDHAHDGQFFLSDQRLRKCPIVRLPRLDHAQPVLGGLELDVGRLWQALANVAWQEAQ